MHVRTVCVGAQPAKSLAFQPILLVVFDSMFALSGRADSLAELYRVAPVEVHRLTWRAAENRVPANCRCGKSTYVGRDGSEKTGADGRIRGTPHG
jgi:hypothetical protein